MLKLLHMCNNFSILVKWAVTGCNSKWSVRLQSLFWRCDRLWRHEFVPRLRQLAADLSLRRSGVYPRQSIWYLWWTKWNWDRFVFECVGWSCQFVSTNALFFFNGSTAPWGPRPPHCFSRIHDHTLHTPHSVGLLWTGDQLVAETSTWQQTTLTTDGHPCPRRDSNPQSQ
jgi:hypothetical protein